MYKVTKELLWSILCSYYGVFLLGKILITEISLERKTTRITPQWHMNDFITLINEPPSQQIYLFKSNRINYLMNYHKDKAKKNENGM